MDLREVVTVLLGLREQAEQHERKISDADRRLDAVEAELRALQAEARLGRVPAGREHA